MQTFRQQLLKTTKQLFDIPESHFPAFYEHDWDRPSHAKKKTTTTTNKQLPYRTGLLFTVFAHDGMVI